MRIDKIPNTLMGQHSSNEAWNYAMQLLQGGSKLMDGDQQPAVENQFQDYLVGIQLYTNLADSETQAAFKDLQTAYENYLADRSIGSSQIMKVISQLQQNPLSLTNAQFKTATKALIEMMHNKVAKAFDTNQQEASNFMNLLSQFSAQSSQAPQIFVEQFLSANTPLTQAYNAYMAGTPTNPQIFALETQLDNLKNTLD